jgi:hypothetical protein
MHRFIDLNFDSELAKKMKKEKAVVLEMAMGTLRNESIPIIREK